MAHFEIRVSELTDPDEADTFFGPPKITVKYRPPGSRTFQTRQAGDDRESNKAMLERLINEVMRRVFEEKKADKKQAASSPPKAP